MNGFQVPDWLDWPQPWALGVLVIAVLCALVLPWPVLGATGTVLGALLIAAGVAFMLAAVWEMRRARTTVVPRRTPGALVTTGVFGISRNPIYLGDALVLAGAMLWLQVPWLLPLVWVFCRIIETRFIRDEEAGLTLAFGAEYGLWAARVRRWFGRRTGR